MNERIRGLDSIRFLLAIVVLVSHLPNVMSGAPTLIRTIFGMSLNGGAAVIAFFVISGFCIHISQKDRKNFQIGPYFARREIRILAPVGVAFLIAWFLNDFRFTTVLWSLVCEEIYYTIYPLLLLLSRKIGWFGVYGVSWSGTIIANIFAKHDGTLISTGYAFQWMLLLPAWIQGCLLAEAIESIKTKPISLIELNIRRLAAYGGSLFELYGRFHAHIDSMYVMPIYGIVCWWWLDGELRRFTQKPPLMLLERLGFASYSIYLVHFFGIGLIERTRLEVSEPLGWGAAVCTSLIFSACFFYLVERPSHKLAKLAGNSLQSRLAPSKAA